MIMWLPKPTTPMAYLNTQTTCNTIHSPIMAWCASVAWFSQEMDLKQHAVLACGNHVGENKQEWYHCETKVYVHLSIPQLNSFIHSFHDLISSLGYHTVQHCQTLFCSPLPQASFLKTQGSTSPSLAAAPLHGPPPMLKQTLPIYCTLDFDQYYAGGSLSKPSKEELDSRENILSRERVILHFLSYVILSSIKQHSVF
jgi:hypothetical protein